MSADHPTRPPPARRRTWLRVGIVLVLIFLGVAAIAAVRYAPLLDQARLARETARSLSAHAGSLDPADLDTASLASLRAELDSLASLLAPFRDLVSCDPLVGIARDLPLVGRHVESADALVAAADALLEAGDLGLDLADEAAAIRAQDA